MRRIQTIALLLLISVIPAQTNYDVLIIGGRVPDGTGNPWFAADVAVKDGRIAAIGNLSGAGAQRTIDARGLYMAEPLPANCRAG